MNSRQLVLFSATWCRPCQMMKESIRGNKILEEKISIADIYDLTTWGSVINIPVVPTLVLFGGLL